MIGRKVVTELDLNKYIGFVYLITRKTTGKKYIGKKLLVKSVKRKNGKRIQVESNWRDYFGSCQELLDDVARLGKSGFTRKILHLCRTRGELNYMEAREQFDRRVLENDNYYNALISVKARKIHL